MLLFEEVISKESLTAVRGSLPSLNIESLDNVVLLKIPVDRVKLSALVNESVNPSAAILTMENSPLLSVCILTVASTAFIAISFE